MVKVYKYALLPPKDDVTIELINKQFNLAHNYNNKLIELENERRSKVRELYKSNNLISKKESKLKKIDRAIIETIAEIKKWRSENKTTKTNEDLSEKLKKARGRSKALLKEIYDCRRIQSKDPKFKAEEKKINQWFKEQVAIVRKSDQAPISGTYQSIEASLKAAKTSKDKKYLFDGIKPNDLDFLSWHRKKSHRININRQVGTYISAQGLFKTNNWVEVDPISEQAWYGKRHQRRRQNKSEFRFRVGSMGVDGSPKKGGRCPIFAKFVIVMHRPLPLNSVITNIQINKHTPRGHTPHLVKWSVDFTVTYPAVTNPPSQDIIACDFGWKASDDSIRVATFMDKNSKKDSDENHYNIPDKLIKYLTKVNDIKSIRSKNKDKIINQINNLTGKPEWFKQIDERVSVNSLIRLKNNWTNERFDGDSEVFNKLSNYIKQDKHLWDWEYNLRAKALKYRREEYRKFAANLARKYGAIAIDMIELNKLSKRRVDKEELNKIARGNRFLVSVSEFRLALKNAFNNRVIEDPPANRSKECNNCKSIEDIGANKRHICSKCNFEYDRDENSCLNTLYACERLGDLQKYLTSRREKKDNKTKEMRERRTKGRKEQAKKDRWKKEALEKLAAIS